MPDHCTVRKSPLYHEQRQLQQGPLLAPDITPTQQQWHSSPRSIIRYWPKLTPPATNLDLIIFIMSFHTGLTPTEETFHTGLTPTDPSFPGTSALQQDLPAAAVTEDLSQFGLFPTDQAPINFSANQLFLPNLDDGLTIPTDFELQDRARRNSVEDILDHSLVAVPSFLEEIQTYGQIVGPSQGLNSNQYLPSRPLNMLTAPGTVPGEPYSLQEPAQPSQPFADMQWAPQYPQDAMGMFGTTSTIPQMQQPLSAIAPSFDPAYPVSYNFPGYSTYATSGYGNPVDMNSFAGYSADFSQFTFQPSMQDTQAGQRKDSSSTNYSSTSPPPGVEKKLPPTEQTKYSAERPEKPADKPWIRVNASTQGKTSRTGKINHYDPEQYYSKIPHPHNPWATDRGKQFSYNQWHELTKNELAVSQLKDFIYKHPKSKDCKLTLYIQRAPADSKRRYPTSTLDKCRFKDCPMRVYGNKGSSMHGHYRVALDELSYKYGKGQHNDPFHVAAYVHLYCLERFLDLPEICTLSHVKVEADARQIAKEPNGNFAPALGGGECRVATNFIEAARKGRLQNHAEWSSYPTQPMYRDMTEASRHEGFKLHRGTLNYALQVAKNGSRGGRVMNRLKPSNVAVHRGDLEMYCLGRKDRLTVEEIQQIEDGLQQADSAPSVSQAPAEQFKKRRRSSMSMTEPAAKKVRY